jgi:hypothetical protein
MTGFIGGGMGMGMPVPAKQDEAPPLDRVQFHPLNEEELIGGQSKHLGMSLSRFGLTSKHRQYTCGACGGTTTGRIVCEVKRKADEANIYWCWCSCEKGEPTILVEKEGKISTQLPFAKSFHIEPDWPKNLADLYEEAAKAHAAGAYTAVTMSVESY